MTKAAAAFSQMLGEETGRQSRNRLALESAAKLAYEVWAHRTGADTPYERISNAEWTAWKEVVTAVLDNEDYGPECHYHKEELQCLGCAMLDGIACLQHQSVDLECPECEREKKKKLRKAQRQKSDGDRNVILVERKAGAAHKDPAPSAGRGGETE